MSKEKLFVFFWLCFCCLVVEGVFADEVKSVMEGDSVTLQTNVTEIQTDDEITWTFGTNRSLIAKITALIIDIPGDLNGIFRDRLKLDNQTGSLTITNTTTEHAGEYEVEISLRSSSPKYRFSVTVYAATTTKPPSTSKSTSRSPKGTSHTSDSPSASSGPILAVQISAAAAGFLLIVALVGIVYICRKLRKTDQHVEAREEEITYADPKFYKRNIPFPDFTRSSETITTSMKQLKTNLSHKHLRLSGSSCVSITVTELRI